MLLKSVHAKSGLITLRNLITILASMSKMQLQHDVLLSETL